MLVPSKRRQSKIEQKSLKLRNQLWPKLDEDRLWIRTEKTGFTTIPRPLPLILGIMDDLSNGKPVSMVYLDLWSRARDDCFIILARQEEMAFSSGYTGQRAVAAWRSRIRILADLGFIDLKSGPSGEYSYALIWNPYLIIKEHRAKKTPGLTEAAYNALQARAVDVGADDLD